MTAETSVEIIGADILILETHKGDVLELPWHVTIGMNGTGAVNSVNGKIGDVILTPEDVGVTVIAMEPNW